MATSTHDVDDVRTTTDDRLPAGTDRSGRHVLFDTDLVRSRAGRVVLGFFRILVGFFFLWPFLDKLFGLGFSTASENSFLNGGTPAQGFLTYAANQDSPFYDFLQLFANSFGDWLFMFALLALGVAVILGMGLKVSAVAGTVLLAMMYLAEWPISTGGTDGAATNPIVDDHWILALSLIVFALLRSGDTLGLGKWWGRLVGDSWLR